MFALVSALVLVGCGHSGDTSGSSVTQPEHHLLTAKVRDGVPQRSVDGFLNGETWGVFVVRHDVGTSYDPDARTLYVQTGSYAPSDTSTEAVQILRSSGLFSSV